MEEALVEMTNAARKVFPNSAFARGCPSDIELVTEPTLVELMWEAEKQVPGFSLHHYPDKDPYEPRWIAERPGSDLMWAGYTPAEALQFMLEALEGG